MHLTVAGPALQLGCAPGSLLSVLESTVSNGKHRHSKAYCTCSPTVLPIKDCQLQVAHLYDNTQFGV